MNVHDTARSPSSSGPGGAFVFWLRQHEVLSFMLLVPIGIATAWSLLSVGMSSAMPLAVAWIFFVLLVLPVWNVTQALTAVAHRLLAAWRPPLWLLCLVGSIGQALLLSPFYRLYFAAAEPFLFEGMRLAARPMPAWTFDYASTLLRELAPGALTWIATNYVWERVVGVARFRYPPDGRRTAAPATPTARIALAASDAAPPPVARPVFMERSKLVPEARVLAVTAEEHYIWVLTDRGADLIRYRFADALEDLASEVGGMRVHRSWWTRLDAVVTTVDRGRSLQLTLRDGTVVPVSLAFREAVLLGLSKDKKVVSAEPPPDTPAP